MNILILNTVALNGGDGAILTALIQGLRARLGPDVDFIVHEAQPEVATRYYPGVTFRHTAAASLGQFQNSRYGEFRRRAKYMLLVTAARRGLEGMVARRLLPDAARLVLDDYRAADVVITTGGTYLVEHYDLSSRLLSFEIAIATRRPLVFYTQSLGPYRSSSVRDALRRILSSAEIVFLRDELSREHVRELGVDTDHLHVVPDCVFALAEPARLTAAATARRPDRRPLRVAISVRNWKHFTTRPAVGGMQQYLDAVRAVTVHLVERHGATVTFLSTCQGIPEYGHDDSRTAGAVVAGLPPGVRESVAVDARFLGTHEMLAQLREYDLVLSTRMHFAILALIAGVPVIPIAYEFKMRELFTQLGQEHWVHDIETVKSEELVASVDSLLAEEGAVRESLFAAVGDAHVRAVAANDRLASLVRCLSGLPAMPRLESRLGTEAAYAAAPGERSRDHVAG